MIDAVSLGGTSLTDGKYHLMSMQAGYPQISHTIVNRGNFHGAKIYPGKFQSMRINTEWNVVGTSFSDFATQRENFRKTISTILATGAKTLSIQKSNGTTLTASIKAAKLSADIKSEDGVGGTFLVEFDAEYPFLLGSVLHSQDVSIYSGGGMAIPMPIPLDLSNGASNLATITAAGEFTAYPTITFKGPLINPTLTNLTTGEQLSIAYTLDTVTDQIQIDTYNRTATLLPSGSNARAYISGDFLTLQPGDNSLVLGAGTYNASAKATVEFYDHYLGV